MTNKDFTILLYTIVLLLTTIFSQAQTATLSGTVSSNGAPIGFANVYLKGLHLGTVSDEDGKFSIEKIPFGTHTVIISSIGYDRKMESITFKENQTTLLNFELKESTSSLNEVVISGTMKEISKPESPVPVEVYTAKFFQSNPTPTIFDALQNVNGVRPQINCNVCNTGDVHINGLEGPYTMVLIDGMPIVSGLATVYGLNGIPQSLVERVEIVKGPASSLYGSEAVGGLINIITKKPTLAPLFSADAFATTWGEINTDIAGKFKVGKRAQSLVGINYFNFQNRVDKNRDNFTDITLQNRISAFNKWNFERSNDRLFTLASRFINEDRWGGDMKWQKQYRGGDEIYGESIYISRCELFGTYQLPIKEKVLFQFSTNGHHQNSAYGNTLYIANQTIAFGQLTWFKSYKKHEFLSGLTYRYTRYDDNTPATADASDININKAAHTKLPGTFIQDEIKLNDKNKLLLGFRYDYNSIHGSILTPRLNYKWNSKSKNDVLRLSVGNGYRVANVFTEDHAALTGARQVEFLADLKPETSWNGNINYVKKIYATSGTFIGLDASTFYTYFLNKIIPDYDTDPNKILYNNLDGNAVSKGVSLNIDIAFGNGLKLITGGTYMDVYSLENGIKECQMFSEPFSGVWSVEYAFNKMGFTLDYTGNVYSPMRLPILSKTDPRSEHSPWWSIQNIQITKEFKKEMEIYVGVKNLLNWTPNKGNPFIIARTNDPFDKEVLFDANGIAVATPNNPYGLTFDPSYVYGPNQGIRFFFGLRYTLS
jgi:outer membrane receptor for ferrienterochelin and colicins